MNSRERIEAACSREPYDRVPIDLGGTFATAFTAPAYDAIRSELGIPLAPGRIVSPQMMLTEMEATAREALGADTVGLYFGGGFVHGWRPWTTPGGTRVEMPGDLEVRAGEGGGWDLYHCSGKQVGIMPPDGLYFDWTEFAKWRDYDPAELTDEVLNDIAERARFCRENTDLDCLCAGPCPTDENCIVSGGGIILIHDYNTDWPELMRAVDTFVSGITESLIPVADADSTVMVIKTKQIS